MPTTILPECDKPSRPPKTRTNTTVLRCNEFVIFLGGKLLNECGRQEGDSGSHIIQEEGTIPQSSAFPHSPGDVLASNSEAGSECIASKNFRSPSIVARCLDASMNHGLRDGDPYNAVCFHSTVCDADMFFVFPQRPHIVLRRQLDIGKRP